METDPLFPLLLRVRGLFLEFTRDNQREAHGFAALAATGEGLIGFQAGFVRSAMGAVDDSIHSRLRNHLSRLVRFVARTESHALFLTAKGRYFL